MGENQQKIHPHTLNKTNTIESNTLRKGEGVYLDYTATTPVDPEVFEAMKPYFSEHFGNASSAHRFGQRARQALDEARLKVAEFFGCRPEEIIFTSGATESNNWAIKGVIKKVRQLYNFKPHVISSAIEHHCVLDTCNSIEEDGLADISFLPVDSDGIVDVSQLKKTINENTVLVSIMYANNEIGSVQPIEEIGKTLKEINLNRDQKNKIYFHTDAVQAINYLDCKVDFLGVDLLSVSAHKFYGPKGAGALFIRKGTPIKKIQDGGAHEFNLRAGTYNIPGIVGLAKAISLVDSETKGRVEKLRNKLVTGVFKNIPDVKLNGSPQKRLANNANFSFKGAEGESIMMALDLEGIAVSTGSACASENLQPSHVLVAIGLDHEDAHTSIRISLGKYTTEKEIDKFLEILPKVIERLRKISGSAEKTRKKLPDDFGC